ncbi:MAG: starch-binding protein [Blautia sp.]|nr:starch-binding protein [Lachnoclostridium sp.]MCM1210480.1 starch-binding protein [Blautia sp.]
MVKSWKKITAYLFMAAAAFALFLPMSVNAEEERTAIYVQVPGDWENPCVWAWDEDGNNAFDAWPGGETEADAGNEGWYYIWIPSWANHVIVNANEGSVQTNELILDGGNAWISVEDAENAEVSYEALTKGDIPEYVEKFVIHASVPESWEEPCLWAWSAPDGTNAFEAWPGAALKPGEDNWYTGKAPVWVNSIIINAKEGSVQTEDIAIDPAEMWITVLEDGSYDFSYDDPNAVSAPDITVNVMAPTDWEVPCLWAWSAPDGTNAFAAWPGEPLAEGENGWLTLSVPGWINSVIVNGNEGSVQTADISVETGKDIWLVVSGAEAYEVFYEEPAGVADTAAETDDTENSADAESGEGEAEESTEAPAEADETEQAGVSTGIVVLIVVVCIVIVALAGYFIMKKRKSVH